MTCDQTPSFISGAVVATCIIIGVELLVAALCAQFVKSLSRFVIREWRRGVTGGPPPETERKPHASPRSRRP
jgi:hypothetical protein